MNPRSNRKQAHGVRRVIAGAALASLAASLPSPDAFAADRQIAVQSMLSVHWSTLTGGTTTPAPTLNRNMAVGFWQRSSGAKAGVGSISTGVVEFQLPENPPQRVRSAVLQFKARASQCTGAEPVVFEVFGYPGNGQADAADATAGLRLGQLRADCRDSPAFAQPIDVTPLVRQLSVASGLRFAGFNVRKLNHRAGPSLFGFSAATLTIVVADQDLAIGPLGAPVGANTQGAPGASGPAADPASLLRGLAGAAATVIAGGGSRAATQQGRDQAAAALRDGASAAAAAAATPADAAVAPAAGGALAGQVDPTDAAAPASAVASTPATGAALNAVGGAVNVDIVGLKLGMTIDEVRRTLRAHSPAVRVDEARGIVNNVAATEYLSWLIARAAQGAPAGSGDAIGVHFPPPPNAHRAIFVERFTGFQPNQYPLFETLRAALVRKFGQPSQEGEGTMLWTFNAAGVQIVDHGVAARCGKFPPIDPPARGQNVLFNGYKSAGCGVTVYARYERGRGPSDRDLVRWLSVSMVDDSRFEDMRQAAARFATQATRAGASNVAAPKL